MSLERNLSRWADSVNPSNYPTLDQNLDLDIAIIGGGFSGLWSAFHLIAGDPNLKIAILPNRIHGSTKNKTIQATLNQLDAVVLDNFVPSKNLFTQSSTILAEKEYLNIAKEILTLL